MARPMPPDHLLDELAPLSFKPAYELDAWARTMFIDDGAVFGSEQHEHLRLATIGYAWTNYPARKGGKSILGTCELIKETGNPWSKARNEFLIASWFDGLPDFLITIYAPYWADSSDRACLALILHEISHAGQAIDEFGAPRFDRHGMPLFAMKSHDFEEFTNVVEMFGATSPSLRTAAESIMAGPLVGDDEISIVCGSCKV